MKTKAGNLRRTMIINLSLLILTVILWGCTKPGSTQLGPNEVLIQGYAFTPGSITVTANTTITWTNKDGVPHTVTSDSGAFDSGTINTNGTYSHTFTSAGTYHYHCTVHPAMTATVIAN